MIALSLPHSIYWGNEKHLHSLYLDIAGAECAVDIGVSTVEWTLVLPPNTQGEAIECSLFLIAMLGIEDPSQQVLVNGLPATAFRLGDRIDLRLVGLACSLEIFLEEGEGKFFGHLLLANRPNQRKKDLKYQAWDWQIALRTLERSRECTLKIAMHISNF